MTIKELKTKLDELGIEYPALAPKAELEQLLEDAQKTDAKEEVVEASVDSSIFDAVVDASVVETVNEVPYTIVELNGKRYKKYTRPDGTTDMELIT